MFFVTTKYSDYVLFAMTPSERAAIGLTADQQHVHLLRRDETKGGWVVFARWAVADFSHTDFMSAWHRNAEPQDVEELLAVLPAQIRSQTLL